MAIENNINTQEGEGERENPFLSEAINLFLASLEDLEKTEELLPSSLESLDDKNELILNNCNNAIIQLRVASKFLNKSSEISKNEIFEKLMTWFSYRDGFKKSIVDFFIIEIIKKGFDIQTEKIKIKFGIKPETEKDLNMLASHTVNTIATVDSSSNIFNFKLRRNESDILNGVKRFYNYDTILYKELKPRIQILENFKIPKEK